VIHIKKEINLTIQTIHTAEPAFSVIEKLGGKSEVAEYLGLDKSTLSRWCQPKPSGTGGLVPQRYWPQLIEMARDKRVRISLKELAAVEV
jgi:transcriptional regulator with XRE-family HTH domain